MRRHVYFEGLNGLRFLAALVVVLYHVGLGLRGLGFPSYAYLDRLNHHTGTLAVLFFFVLSGFLISYLLLVEERETGKIAVGAFYVRRILRIWPLYYLIVVIAFFVVPHWPGSGSGSFPVELYGWQNLLFYLAIFPNLAAATPYADHLWSIGVEEQFYLCWPILMRIVHRRLALFIGVVAVYQATVLLLKARMPLLERIQPLTIFLVASRIDAMAMGGLAAWLLFRRVEPALRLLHSRWTQVATLAGLAALYLRAIRVPPRLSSEVYIVLFMVVILNVASNPRSLLRFPGRPLERLGKISYGIYMYHPLIVALVTSAVAWATAQRGLPFVVACYGLGVAATILVAAVSYRFLEMPILKQKLRVSPLVTGDLAAEP